MKRIQIRFFSLISEKIFSAKRAHPTTNCSVKDPASAALVAEVLLNERKVYLSHSGTLRNLAISAH